MRQKIDKGSLSQPKPKSNIYEIIIYALFLLSFLPFVAHAELDPSTVAPTIQPANIALGIATAYFVFRRMRKAR